MHNGTLSLCHLIAGMVLIAILVTTSRAGSEQMRKQLELTSQWIHAVLVLLVAFTGLVLTA